MARSLYVAGTRRSGQTTTRNIWLVTATGALTRLTGNPPVTLHGMAEHGEVLYAASQANDRLYTVDVTGDSFTISDRGAFPSALNRVDTLVSHGGSLLAIDSTGDVWNVNVTTPGSSTRVASDITGAGSIDGSASLAGTLYILEDRTNPDRVWSVAISGSTATGTLVGAGPTGGPPHFNSLRGMTSQDGKLYAANVNQGLWEIDLTNVAASKFTGSYSGDSGITIFSIASHDPDPQRPPTFDSQQANVSFLAGSPITPFTLPGAKGQTALTYSTSTLPRGLIFTPATRRISGTPTEAGTVTVTYTARDTNALTVSQTFDITIRQDLMPGFGSATIPNQTYTQNERIPTLQLPIASSGDAPITYSVSPLPSGLAFNAILRRITGTPQVTGTRTIIYTAKDSDGDSARLTFTITVNAPLPPDTAPTVKITTPDQQIAGSQQIQVQSSVTGNPEPTVEWSASAGVITETGVFIAPAATHDVQTITVTLTARNSVGSASDTVTFTIAALPIAPVSFGSQTVRNQEYFELVEIAPLTLPAATGGRDALTYSVSGLPVDLVFTPATRRIEGTPRAQGTSTITYTARDRDGRTARLTFTVKVVASPTSRSRVTVERVETEGFPVAVTVTERGASSRGYRFRYRPEGTRVWTETAVQAENSITIQDISPAIPYTYQSSIEGVWATNTAVTIALYAEGAPEWGIVQVFVDTDTPWGEIPTKWQNITVGIERVQIRHNPRVDDPLTGWLPCSASFNLVDLTGETEAKLIPSAHCQVTWSDNAGTVSVFRGYLYKHDIGDPYEYAKRRYSVVARDVFERWNNVEVRASTENFPAMSTSQFINTVLDHSGDIYQFNEEGEPLDTRSDIGPWPESLRDIDEYLQQTPALDTDGFYVVSQLLEEVRQASVGRLFARRDGVVTFQNQKTINRLADGQPSVTFDASDGNIRISSQRETVRDLANIIRAYGREDRVTGYRPSYVSVDRDAIRRDGPQRLRPELTNQLIADQRNIQKVALINAAIRRNPTVFATVEVKAHTGAQHREIAEIQVGDLVRLVSPQDRVDKRYFVFSLDISYDVQAQSLTKARIVLVSPQVLRVWRLGDGSGNGSPLFDSAFLTDQGTYEYPEGVTPGGTVLGY